MGRFSYTAGMTPPYFLHSLNLQVLVTSGKPLVETIPLQNMERLAGESVGLQPDSMVNFQVVAELRTGTTGQPDTWLHLQASTSIAMTCQRCMGHVQVPVQVDQWYRFVASEDVAMAEDDASDEDLLVMTPQFDLISLLEDELLMALPLVPMHDVCPVVSGSSPSTKEILDDLPEKPHPFGALAQLKKK